MAEKIKELNLERDYKKYLYFVDGDGSVCQKPKSGEGQSEGAGAKRRHPRQPVPLLHRQRRRCLTLAARISGREEGRLTAGPITQRDNFPLA